MANTNTTQSQSVDVILETTLSAPGDNLRVLYSNKSAPTAPAPVRTLNQVTVAEVDGTTGTGPTQHGSRHPATYGGANFANLNMAVSSGQELSHFRRAS